MSVPANPDLEKLAAEVKADETKAKEPEVQEVKLATGQVYRGTPEQIIGELTKAQTNASLALQELKRQNEALAQQVPRQPQGQPAEFDAKHYWELMEKDPRLGNRYAWAADLGIPEDQVSQALSFAVQTATEVQRDRHLVAFYAQTPEYDANPDNAQLLIDRLQQSARPPTADNLKLSFMELVTEGRMKALEAPVAPETGPREAIPPSLAGGPSEYGGATDVLAEKIMTGSEDEVEALVRKMGMKR